MSISKRLKRCIAAFAVTFAMIMSFSFTTINPMAADVSISIAVSASSVSVGSSVSATVSVSGSSLSAYTMYVSYNSAVLQFNSGSGAVVNGGGGTVSVSGTGAGSVTLSFSAIANGSSSIATSGSDFLNIEGNELSVSHAGVSITVGGGSSTTDKTDSSKDSKTTEKDATTEEDDSDKSSECSLSSLAISPGTLEPAFSADTTSYFVQVDKDVTSMVVSATPKDSKATTQVWGAGLIEPGENTVKITVTAEDGTVKVYNLRVVAGEDLGDASAEIDGEVYKFATNENVDGIPDDFVSTTIKYKDWDDVLAFQSPNKKITVVCLFDVEENIKWFIYDAEKEEFTPYNEFSAQFNRYIILSLPEDYTSLGEFEKVSLKIDSNEVEALQGSSLNDDNFYIVYAMNLDTDEAYYIYDKVEGTFIRYVAPTPVTVEVMATPTEVTATPMDANQTVDNSPKKDNVSLTLAIIFGILFAICAICVIALIVKLKGLKGDVEAAENMVDSLSNGKGVDRTLLDVYDSSKTEVPVNNPSFDGADTANASDTANVSDNAYMTELHDEAGANVDNSPAKPQVIELIGKKSTNSSANGFVDAVNKIDSDIKEAKESSDITSEDVTEVMPSGVSALDMFSDLEGKAENIKDYDAEKDSAFADEGKIDDDVK